MGRHDGEDGGGMGESPALSKWVMRRRGGQDEEEDGGAAERAVVVSVVGGNVVMREWFGRGRGGRRENAVDSGR